MANEIKARITADATGFSAGLGKAARALDGASQRWERQFAGLNRGVAAFAGFLAGGVAIGALDNLAKSALRAGGAIDDASKTAGIGAAALQEYRFAAQQSGIEIEQLDKAIAKFVINLGEARRGNKEYAATFTQIGVAASDSNERALEKTFEFLAGIGDRAQRASVAAELFGARAARMAIFVEGGAESLAKMRSEARDLGIVLGDDLVAKADAVGDRIDALEKAMSARLNVAVLKNIDGFEKWKILLNDASILMLKLAASAGEAADRFSRLTDQFPQFKLSADADLVDIVKRREKLANDLRKNEKQLSDALNFANSPLGNAPLIGGRNAAGIQFLSAAVARQKLELSALDAASVQARTKLNPAPVAPAGSPAAEFAVGAGSPAAPSNPFPGLAAPTLKIAAFTKQTEESGKAIARVADQVRTPFEALKLELAEIQRLMPFAENAEELALLERAADGLEGQIKQLDIASKLWGVTLTDVAQGLSASFTNAVFGSENLLKSLGRLAKQLAAQALQSFLFKTIGTALGIPALPGLASGGPVSAGRSFLVGEQGPEIFTPNVSGAIIPNGSFGGGVSVNVVNRFDVGLESIDQRIGSLTPAISASVVDAVVRAQNRPRFA